MYNELDEELELPTARASPMEETKSADEMMVEE